MKIIVPLDFSSNSMKAMEFALALADKKHGSITLVHVVEMVYDFASQASLALDSMYKDGENLLKKTIAQYKGNGIPMDYQLTEGTPSISIARIAEELNATLIVIGTQGVSGIKKTLMGSVTISLVREAQCPVLIVPSEAKVSEIRKITLALEFANHEEAFLDLMVDLSKRWEMGFEVLHVQTSLGFRENLIAMGIECYLAKKYPVLPFKIHTYYAETASEGIETYMEEYDDIILVMCHQHRSLWDQIIKKSQSIRMAYHTHIPLLILT